jgi:ketosteroid isomerase-like protein
VERADVERWVTAYERAWRAPGTELLAEIFTPDVSYLPSPWGEPVEGLDALTRFWDDERDGPDDQFTMASEVVAVDGDVAVVRVSVDYEGPPSRWRDLWVVTFTEDGRCRRFEEWPFAPEPAAGV